MLFIHISATTGHCKVKGQGDRDNNRAAATGFNLVGQISPTMTPSPPLPLYLYTQHWKPNHIAALRNELWDIALGLLIWGQKLLLYPTDMACPLN